MEKLYTQYLQLLKDFIALKSVSTDSNFKTEIDKTAQWLQNLLSTNGFKVEIIEGYDNPLVFAEYISDPKNETCLIYGHYDVQPASLEDGWNSDPFELTEKDGRLVARGSVDNKGQILIHIASIIDLIKEGALNYNIKFLIEGNEETGSPNLRKFVEEKADKLKADFIMISDGELTMGHPTIELGFRGVFNSTVSVKTSTKDVHSGLYGGTMPSATFELIKILGKIKDEKGNILIPNYYYNVPEILEEEKATNASIPFNVEEFKNLTGSKKLLTEEGLNFYDQVGFRPSVEITGIKGGYIGEGYKNIVPGYAEAKVSFRITADQDPHECAQMFEKYIQSLAPNYLEVNVKSDQFSKGVKLDVTSKYADKAKDLLAEVFETNCLLKYCGATLPIVTDFSEVLKTPQVLVPLGNEDCNMHGADENFSIDILKRGLAFSNKFFGK